MRFSAMILLLTFAGLGCSKVDETLLQENRVIKLLDQQRYQDVIEILTPEIDDSNKERLVPYLAQANLGLAGFEPMAFAARVMREQIPKSFATPEIFVDCPLGAIGRYDTVEPRCMVMRLFNQLPDPDNRYFARARELFRATFPDPELTPDQHNLLSGIVEVATALGRMSNVVYFYAESRPEDVTDDEIAWFFEQIVLGGEASIQGISRALNSPDTISRHLTGLESSPIFIGNSLKYYQMTGIPMLMNMARKQDEVSADRIYIVNFVAQLIQILQGRTIFPCGQIYC